MKEKNNGHRPYTKTFEVEFGNPGNTDASKIKEAFENAIPKDFKDVYINMKKEGLRFNNGKTRMDLINPLAIKGLSEVLTMGANKYGDRNWEIGMKWSKIIASLKRHLNAIEVGEDYDKESGLLHVDHLQANAHMLSTYFRTCPEFDDRDVWYKKPFKKLFIDIDGVIADFEKGVTEKYNLSSPPHDWADHRYVSILNELKNDKDFWLNLEPLIKAEDIKYPIAGYCTARSIPNEWIIEWLQKHLFPQAPIIKLEFGQSKALRLKEAGCEVFIDDSINNFVDLNSNGILCYLASRSHNEKYDVGHLRVKGLADLINKLKQ